MKNWNIVEQYESATSAKKNNYKITYSKRSWYDRYRLSSTVEESKNKVSKRREIF